MAFSRKELVIKTKLEDNASKGLKKLGDNADKAANAMMAVGTAAAAAIGGAIKQAMEFSDELLTTSERIGVSTKSLQELRFVADRYDISQQAMTKGLSRFSKVLYDADRGLSTATEAFGRLGLNIYDTDGNLRDVEDAFNETVGRMADMENQTERNALAMEIFGRSAGPEMIPMLNAGIEEVNRYREAAQDLGIVLGDDLLERNAELEDQMKVLKSQYNAVIVQLGSEFLPIVTDLVKEISNLINNKEKLADTVGNIKTALIGLMAVGAIGFITKMTIGIINMVTAAKNAIIAIRGMKLASISLTTVLNAMPLVAIATGLSLIALKAIEAANALESAANAELSAAQKQAEFAKKKSFYAEQVRELTVEQIANNKELSNWAGYLAKTHGGIYEEINKQVVKYKKIAEETAKTEENTKKTKENLEDQYDTVLALLEAEGKRTVEFGVEVDQDPFVKIDQNLPKVDKTIAAMNELRAGFLVAASQANQSMEMVGKTMYNQVAKGFTLAAQALGKLLASGDFSQFAQDMKEIAKQTTITILQTLMSVSIAKAIGSAIAGDFKSAAINAAIAGAAGIGIGVVSALAEGGIVTGPTQALIGEGGEPEAVIPLSKMGEVFNTYNQQQTATNVTIISPIDNTALWRRQVERYIGPQMEKYNINRKPVLEL